MTARPHMYEVHGGHSKSFLCGTFHYWPAPEAYMLKEMVQCTRFIGEAVPGALEKLLSSSTSLTDAGVGPDIIDRFAALSGIPAEFIGSLPLGICVLLPPCWMLDALKSTATHPIRTLDEDLSSQAEAAKLERYGIDDMELVCRTIAAHADPLEPVLDLLESYGTDEHKQLIVNMWDAYRIGEVYTVMRMMSALEEDSALSGLKGFVFGERNALWEPQLVRHLEEAPCFIAVGLAHLFPQPSIDEPGIIARLKHHGYTVTLVPLNSDNKEGDSDGATQT